MTPTRSSALRPRWRSIIATFALVGALVATTSAMSASADVVGTGPGTISGTVTSNSGQPLESAGVSVSVSLGQGTPFSAYTVTDAAGHYEFTGLEAGPYDISTYVSGYQTQPWQTATLTVASPTATIGFVLVPYPVGNGTISGYVTADGVPLAGFEVSLTNQTTYQNPSMLTDADGYFHFTGLANGTWAVTSWGGPAYQLLPATTIVLSDSSNTATANLPFVSWPVGTASIHGVVTDAATGLPIAGVNVGASSQDAPHNSGVTTGADGTFSFDLLPKGTYYLSFWSFGYLGAETEVPLLAGQSVNASRPLVAANASIGGHVQDVTGAPVVGLYVDAHAQDGSFGIGGAETDSNGDYLITNVGAVPYILNVGGWGLYNAQERTVTPIANDNIVVDFTLTFRTVGSISGAPVGPEGAWLDESHPICVTLYSIKTKKAVATTATYGPEFGDGFFTFVDLKPGSYTVEFKDCNPKQDVKFEKIFLGGVKNMKDATVLTIVAGQDIWVENAEMIARK